MHGFYWDWGHGPFWGGGIFMILFWACIIFLIIAVLKSIFKREHLPETALDILKKRYAKGEINKDEFEQMKKTLTLE
jgi:putative membrane protein